MKKQNVKGKCLHCSKCCTYFCLEIDAPDCRDDFDNLSWMLAHENVSIHLERDGTWQLMVKNRCKYLMDEGGCKIYDERPKICREHPAGECDFDVEREVDYNNIEYIFVSLNQLHRYRDKFFPEKKRAISRYKTKKRSKIKK